MVLYKKCKVFYRNLFCAGCQISTTDDPINITPKEFAKDFILVVDWNPEALYLKYNHYTEMVFFFNLTYFLKTCQDDNSYSEAVKAHTSALSLNTCFEEFIKTELISDSVCEKCDKKTEREKVIHLKRFIYMPLAGRHVKSTKAVDFPLKNFNPSEFISNNSEFKSMNHTYKCIGIVNHHGQMNCGHYTSYVNSDDQWYFFNDSFCKLIKEEQIKKQDAYLIFYEKINV